MPLECNTASAGIGNLVWYCRRRSRLQYHTNRSLFEPREGSVIMEKTGPEIKYPRRRFIRDVMRGIIYILFDLLSDLEISGREHLPAGGPLLVAANHFSFIDPALVVRVTPWPLEVIGGAQLPYAPFDGTWILKLWGYFPTHRGTCSRTALRSAEAVLAQGGVVGIAPEGGAWATVLRPARPGAAFLATRTGARILPVGIDGATDVFPSLRNGRRAHVTVRIDELFGPFQAGERGQKYRFFLYSDSWRNRSNQRRHVTQEPD